LSFSHTNPYQRIWIIIGEICGKRVISPFSENFIRRKQTKERNKTKTTLSTVRAEKEMMAFFSDKSAFYNNPS